LRNNVAVSAALLWWTDGSRAAAGTVAHAAPLREVRLRMTMVHTHTNECTTYVQAGKTGTYGKYNTG
jgi:hypothetical protein